MGVAVLARREVDVGQSIELVEHDVYVAAAYAGREGRDALAVAEARYGVKFAVAYLAFDALEVAGYHRHAVRVAYEDNLVGYLRRTQVQVKDRAVGVEYQFGGRVVAFICHGVDDLYECVVYFPSSSALAIFSSLVMLAFMLSTTFS